MQDNTQRTYGDQSRKDSFRSNRKVSKNFSVLDSMHKKPIGNSSYASKTTGEVKDAGNPFS